MDLEKLSDKGLQLLMEARKAEAETLFKAALEADELADAISAEIARRGIVGVAQNDAATGETVQVEVGQPPKIFDIASHPRARALEVSAEPLIIHADPSEPACEGGAQHDWERIREGLEVILDACRLCPLRRFVEIPEGEADGEITWSYGSPPPPKQHARIMKEDEELEAGEEWMDTDGNVPQNITRPQQKITRITDGRKVIADP